MRFEELSGKFKFRRLDIFGKEIQLKVEGSEKYKTNLGGIFTILLFSLSLLSVWFFGKDIIYKETPRFITKNYLLPEFPFVSVNSSSFFYSFRLTDYFGTIIDNPRVLIPKFSWGYFVTNKTSESYDMVEYIEDEMHKCNISDIDQDTFKRENLGAYYCSPNLNLEFGGTWGADKVGTYRFYYEACNKNHEEKYNITCLNRTEIESLYPTGIYVETKFKNFIMDPTNYLNPLSEVINYRFQVALLWDYRKSITEYWTFSSLTTDDGLIFENNLTRNFTQVGNSNTDLLIRGEDDILLEYITFMTKTKNEYGRSYLKIQEVAATVGGFFSICYYLLWLIYYFYVDNVVQGYYYDNLIDFSIEAGLENSFKLEDSINRNLNHNQDMSKDTITIVPFRSTTGARNQLETEVRVFHSKFSSSAAKSSNYNNHRGLIYLDNDQTNELNERKKRRSTFQVRLDELVKQNKLTRQELNITNFQIFTYRMCSLFRSKKTYELNKLNQLLFLAEYEINKRIDTLQVLKLVDQINVIKKVLFNEHQCLMLDNKGKQIVLNKTITSRKDFIQELELIEQKKEEALIEYLQSKVSLVEKDSIDMLLLHMMRQDLKDKILKKVKFD